MENEKPYKKNSLLKKTVKKIYHIERKLTIFMGLFDFDLGLRPPTKKQRKRQTIRDNQRQGRAAEEQAMMRDNMTGYETERTGRGHDYRRRKRNPFTGRVTKSEVVEVKSGNAKLSPLQKKTKKKKSNYRVVRENPLFY